MKLWLVAIIALITLPANAGSMRDMQNGEATRAAYNGDLKGAKNCEAQKLWNHSSCEAIRKRHRDWFNADGSLKSGLKPK